MTDGPRVPTEIMALMGYGPVLSISEFVAAPPVEVVLKIEGFSPGGSVKDKTALGLVRAAEKRGTLRPGGTIVVSTSGNLGVSLGMICAKKGYGLICVVDSRVPPMNINIYRALGARIEMVSTPDLKGGFQQARVERALRLIEGNDYVYLDQYEDAACQQVHYDTTGPELWQACGGRIDVVIGSISTGGHLSGTVRYLKEMNPNIVAIAVEPVGSVIFGGTPSPYLQRGAGSGHRPGNYDASLIDRELRVSDQDAFSVVRSLARREGILLGGSSGGPLWAALEEAREAPRRFRVIAALCPDHGFRYLDTIYSEEWARNNA